MHIWSPTSTSSLRLTMQKKIMTIVRMTIIMIIAQMAEPEKSNNVELFVKKSQNLDPPFRRRVKGLAAEKSQDRGFWRKSSLNSDGRYPWPNGQRPGAFGRKLELLWIKCHQVTRCPIVFDVNQGQSHIVENLIFSLISLHICKKKDIILTSILAKHG